MSNGISFTPGQVWKDTWEVIGNPCVGPNAEKTFFAQSAFVFPVAGKNDAYIAMFDMWNKTDIGSSRYVWLPIRFEGDRMTIKWMDEWGLSIFANVNNIE